MAGSVPPLSSQSDSSWAALPTEPLAALPPRAGAVINIYFAVTHTSNSVRIYARRGAEDATLIHVNAAVVWGEGQLVSHLGWQCAHAHASHMRPSTQAVIIGRRGHPGNEASHSELRMGQRWKSRHPHSTQPRCTGGSMGEARGLRGRRKRQPGGPGLPLTRNK